MKLKNKLGINYQYTIVIASLLPIIIFGFLTYNNFKKESIAGALKHIENVNIQSKKDIEKYFSTLKFRANELTKTISFLEQQAKNNIVNIQTLQKNNIEDLYASIEKDMISLSRKDIFQYIYDRLQRGKKVNDVYLKTIKDYKNGLGFKNILLINKKGKILYSTDKKNLIGTYAQEFSSSYKSIISKLQYSKFSEDVHIANFSLENLAQKHSQYALIKFERMDGYIALEVAQAGLQKSIANVASLGKSAETYLTYESKGKTYLASNRHVKSGKVGDAKSGKHIDFGFFANGVDIKYGSLGTIELVGYMPVHLHNIVLSMQTTVAYTDIVSPLINGKDYFEAFVHDNEYHNIMLVGTKGDIFYSVKSKWNDKNLLSDTYENTHLQKAVQKVFQTKKYVLTDVGASINTSDNLAQFALTPILREDGSVQSIVIIQLEEDYFEKILHGDATTYKTYDTYVVNQDGMLRSKLLQEKQSDTQKSFTVDKEVFTQALKQGVTTDIARNYLGDEVLSSVVSIELAKLEWYVISEVTLLEIEEQLLTLKYNILMFILISSLVALAIMIIITNTKKKQDKKIHYTATHDSLTGLPNRKFALEFLSFMLAKQKRQDSRGAVLFLDLDKFKTINDSYGHDVGDTVLMVVAQRLKKALRKEDLVARLGGDEFIIILNDFHSLVDIDHLCEKLIGEIALPIIDDVKTYEVGLSIGISIFPQDSNIPEELLQFADTAMYKTKDNGRNGFSYYSKDMTEQSLRVSRVVEKLKEAIINDELELHYQPQIDIQENKIVGVEALVRWRDPVDGLIMPNDFIPIAEESSLIRDLGYWVAEEACKAFKRWQDLGIELEYIAVNMSTKQLQSKDCVSSITQILGSLDFDPKNLELEITENTLIVDFERTRANIDALREIGIKFSIDDFGTGYSSLSYLKSLNISTLKIDREFVKDIIADREDRAIVDAIIGMGHTLNYKIVAEGAETKEEIVLLKHFTCDIVQGYYYSKPLEENALLTYINNEDWDKHA